MHLGDGVSESNKISFELRSHEELEYLRFNCSESSDFYKSVAWPKWMAACRASRQWIRNVLFVLLFFASFYLPLDEEISRSSFCWIHYKQSVENCFVCCHDLTLQKNCSLYHVILFVSSIWIMVHFVIWQFLWAHGAYYSCWHYVTEIHLRRTPMQVKHGVAKERYLTNNLSQL